MQKLSVLVFTSNDIDGAFLIVKQLYDIADQIVVVDSSAPDEFDRLKKFKRDGRFNRLDIFRAPAFGYADPVREYGLLCCKHNWVLYLDSDELINNLFKKEIKRIITEAKTKAFAIKRYEEAHIDGTTGTAFTWQTRLYDKRFIKYKGNLHEHPILKGHIIQLKEEYHMLHIKELRHRRTYSKIEVFDCLSYKMYNQRLMWFLQSMSPSTDIMHTGLGKAVYALIRTYEKLGFKSQDQEISQLDYILYYTLRSFMLELKRRDLIGAFKVIPKEATKVKHLISVRKRYGAEKSFEISKIIERKGIIEYLGLDNKGYVQQIARKYPYDQQGVGLLLKLLVSKYDAEHNNQ